MRVAEKLVPELRFPGWGGDWALVKLGELLSFKNGLNASKEKYGRGVKFINVLDIINNSVIIYDRIIGRIDITDKEFKKNEVVYGDILFQRSSETREEVGQANVYLDKEKSAVFGGFIIRGHKKQDYFPMFMNYLLKTSFARKEITTKSGGSTRYNVGQDILNGVNIVTPEILEQQKIASFLSAVDKKIEKLTRKKELLEKYKKGVMQKIFSREIRFKDENGNDYPDWEEQRWGDILRFISTNSFSRKDLNYTNGKIKNIHYGDVHTRFRVRFDVFNEVVPYINNTIDLSRIDAEHYCKVGDIVMADASEDYKDIGKTIEICNLSGEKVVSGLHTFLGRDSTLEVANGFKGYLMQSKIIRRQIQKIAQGISVLGISKKNVLKISFHLPCIDEQKKIVNLLSNIDRKLETMNFQLTQTQKFKKGLLQKMFV